MPAPGVSGLSAGALPSVAPVCRDCVWWQSRGNRTASKQRWIERAEEEWGEWGSIYLDDHGRLLGSLQYGPAHLFPRAADLPAGPASDDAALVTCVYLLRGADRLGREVAPPRRDRRVARPRGHGPGGVRLPLPRARDTGGAVPRPPDGVPARLPRRVRVRDAPLAGPRRALPARARGPPAGRGGAAGEGAARRPGRVHADAGPDPSSVASLADGAERGQPGPLDAGRRRRIARPVRP